MVSWRSWFAVVLVGLAVAAACSGKTDGPPSKGTGGSAGRSNVAGNAGRGGSAGNAANVGGTVGFPEGGEGGVPATPVGGSAGGLVAGNGFGGTAGSLPSGGGVSGVGIAGQNVGGANNFPPFTWTCPLASWGDGKCDCGCGAKDPDCKDNKLATCKVCNAVGSCNGAECPGRIEASNPILCEPVPVGWTCPHRNYDDGQSCDCGCGAADPDCDDEGRDACDACALVGSCSFRDCPGAIDADDNSQCFIPTTWACNTFDYGDGICDCGCSAKDVDCPSLSGDDCEFCSHGCSFSSCPGTIDPNNNIFCTDPPFDWYCAARFYNDGAICHCGCGAIDPDCDPLERESCDRCNVAGSCSGQDCPGTIDPDNIGRCVQPDPPEEWTCEFFYYADGATCDCGCGAFDPDCRGTTPASCTNCWGCGECPGRVDPQDISSCLPPPDGWTCAEEIYADTFSCDCGCGVIDPDCYENNIDYCSTCPEGSCSRNDCRDIDPMDIASCDGGIPPGWNCPNDYFGDSACDCGCGGRDEDCASLNVSACEFCDSPGSCSTDPTCPGTIAPTDNTTCE
jgi:hypothetical protein